MRSQAWQSTENEGKSKICNKIGLNRKKKGKKAGNYLPQTYERLRKEKSEKEKGKKREGGQEQKGGSATVK